MKAKSPHLHKDGRVSIARVDAFAEAGREEQLAVLTELRRRSGEDSNDVQSTVMVAAFGVLATVFVAPLVSSHISPAGSQASAAGLAIGLTVAIVIVICLVPVIGFSVIHSHGRERAGIWLHAYENELQRRWLSTGIAARAWRRRH